MIEGYRLTVLHGEDDIEIRDFWVTEGNNALVLPKSVIEKTGPLDIHGDEVVFSTDEGVYFETIDLSPGSPNGIPIFVGSDISREEKVYNP